MQSRPDGVVILCSLAFELANLVRGLERTWRPGLGRETPRIRKNRLQKGTVMMLKRTASFALTTACLTAIATMPAHAQMGGPYGTTPGYNAPQSPAAYGTTPGYTTPQGPAAYGSAPAYNTPKSNAPQANQSGAAQSASARRNVIESRQYDREVETNRAFRQARMRKECGPITDPELRQSCLASFNQEESQMGSSTSSRGHSSESADKSP